MDRTCNIIVHNIPESDREEPGIRKGIVTEGGSFGGDGRA